jgi:hypothetical protein
VGAPTRGPLPANPRPPRLGPPALGNRAPTAAGMSAATGPHPRGVARAPPNLTRLGPNEKETVEASRDRLRALDSYSVEESALLQSEPSSERQ